MDNNTPRQPNYVSFYHHDVLAARLSCLGLEGVENLGDVGGRLSPPPPPRPPFTLPTSTLAGTPPPSSFGPPVLLLNMLAAHSGKGDRGEVSGVGGRPGVEGNWMPKAVDVAATGAKPLGLRRCRGGLRTSGREQTRKLAGGRDRVWAGVGARMTKMIFLAEARDGLNVEVRRVRAEMQQLRQAHRVAR